MINIEKLLKSKHVEVQMLNVEDITGEFVKSFRKQQRFSQVAMANILGVSKKSIEKWEQGKNNIGGSSKILLKLLYENPELIEKIYSAKVYKAGEKEVAYKAIARNKIVCEEQTIYYVSKPKLELQFDMVGELI